MAAEARVEKSTGSRPRVRSMPVNARTPAMLGSRSEPGLANAPDRAKRRATRGPGVDLRDATSEQRDLVVLERGAERAAEGDER